MEEIHQYAFNSMSVHRTSYPTELWHPTTEVQTFIHMDINVSKTSNGRKRKECRSNPIMYNWNKIYIGYILYSNYTSYDCSCTLFSSFYSMLCSCLPLLSLYQKAMSKEAIIRKSRRIEKETHIPTLHIKRKNGIKKITVEWSSLLICHLGSVKSNSRNLRGDCHEPWVDTWDRIQKNRKMPFSYHPH